MAVIQKIDPQTIQKHEHYLIKHFLQIHYQQQLISGSLSQLPEKQVVIPRDSAIINNNCDISNKNIQDYDWDATDPNGLLKIDNNGCLHLLDKDKKFLFNYFQLPTKGFKFFVLIKDLINVLHLNCTVTEFNEKYNDCLLPVKIVDDRDWKFLYDNDLISKKIDSTTRDGEYQVITTRSAFIMFGASIISCGVRIIDDYWEDLIKKQGFTTHHRVFKYDDKLVKLLKIMKPNFFEKTDKINTEEAGNGNIDNDEHDTKNPHLSSSSFEQPFSFISEQNSIEVKSEYLKQFTQGEHITTVVPGQNINGSLEISAQFKLPKYHFKNSFLQAIQNNSLDVPIGQQDLQLGNTPTNATGTAYANQNSNQNVEVGSTKRSMTDTYSINDKMNNDSSSQMTIPTTLQNSPVTVQSPQNSPPPPAPLLLSPSQPSSTPSIVNTIHSHNRSASLLNFNGWKFDSLPIKTSDNDNDKSTSNNNNNIRDNSTQEYSLKGLPYYDKTKLLKRLKYLTPNEIKEIEHQHDSLFVDVGLQRVRKVRNSKWEKYWQYKSGIPIGLLNNEEHLTFFRDEYLKETLNHVDIVSKINEFTNQEEIQTTKRKPNANSFNNSNIKSFKPPYA